MDKMSVGHVTATPDGDNLHFKCNACDHEETVIDYKGGKLPRFIVWQTVRMDGKVYVKCEKCGETYERVIPFAR